MKLSKKSEYACLALIDLSEQYKKESIKIIDIARRKNIPKKYLEQILLILKNAGIVRSKKGSEGGYRLNKPPKDVSMAEVVRLMDGELAPVKSVSTYFYENTPIEQNAKLVEVLLDVRNYCSTKMESTNFEDLSK